MVNVKSDSMMKLRKNVQTKVIQTAEEDQAKQLQRYMEHPASVVDLSVDDLG